MQTNQHYRKHNLFAKEVNMNIQENITTFSALAKPLDSRYIIPPKQPL